MYTPIPIRRMRPLLGTFVEIGIDEHCVQAQKSIHSAFATIERIHALLSFQLPTSELSQLNAAPRRWVQLSTISLRVLKLARAMMLASDHRFNCTVGGKLIEHGMLPDHSNKFFISVGDADDIEIEGSQARLKRSVRITLDGIAKGFAVDCAIAVLKKHNVRYGWVNAGGDLRVFGDYVLPIAQRHADGSIRSLGGLQRAALATSQTGCWFSAKFPSQIVFPAVPDCIPSAGKPSVVSVIARHAWRADALTKVAATSSINDRTNLVARLGGLLVEETITCAA